MKHEKEGYHNFYKLTEHLNGKHFLYAGLATTTLIGGMGATPLVLADKNSTNQTELVTKVATKTKNKRAGDALLQAGDPYDFTAADFSVKNGVLRGFSESFFDKLDDMLYGDDYRWNGILTFPPEFAETITSIGEYAFSSDEGITSVDFNSLTALKTIDQGAFEGCMALETIDISNLNNLTTIDDSAFDACSFLNKVTLNNLPNLRSIGNYAFADGFYTNEYEDMADAAGSVSFTNLPKLKTIGEDNFSYAETLASVTFSGLDSLEALPERLFYGVNSLKTVTFDGLSKITTISEGLFSDNEYLKSVTFNNLASLQTIEDSVFDYTGLQTLTLTNLPNLINISEYVYESSSDDESLNQIIVGNVNSALTVDKWAFNSLQPSGIVVPLNGQADVAAAQKFLGAINNVEVNNFVGSQKWKLGGIVTYKYVDQEENVITTDTKRAPVNAFTITGQVGTAYDLPTLPKIDGFGNPQLLSGDETGEIALGMQEIVYQYQAATSAITIYRVDTNDKNLVVPETVTGYVNDILDLDDKQLAINGYDFQALNISATNPARAVAAITWQAAPDSVGKVLTLGANAGHSYKFVYAKTAAPKADDSSSTSSSNNNTNNNTNNTDNTNNNANTASTGTSAASSSSANTPGAATSSSATDSVTTPSSSTNQEPGGLPSTGGNATDSSNSTGGTNNTSRTNTSSNTRYVPLSSDTGLNNANSMYAYDDGEDESLPQSGITVNRVLPVLGAIALAGVIGLYAFSKKKRKG